MTVKRNVEGLRQNAQKKREQALAKVEQGIRQLLKEGKNINFNTVSLAADVSKAFLYKEPQIKERIEQLRQQGGGKKVETKQRASDASKDNIIRMLRERVKRLEAEVKDLRKQNEVAYGQIVEVGSLRQQIARLQSENEQFKKSSNIGFSCTTSHPSAYINLEAEVARLGVQLNPTIRRLIKDAPVEIVSKSLDSLREAVTEGRVDNPSGFFNRAVTQAWQANKDLSARSEQDVFNEWYPLAYKAGLVIAATEIDHEKYVCISNEEWHLFSEILKLYPVENIAK